MPMFGYLMKTLQWGIDLCMVVARLVDNCGNGDDHWLIISAVYEYLRAPLVHVRISGSVLGIRQNYGICN
jgi:sulfur relay (sulfurtransferase) DsrC/TusE family protein